MLTMSQINDIRDLSQKGYSISKISSLTGLDRKTVRKKCLSPAKKHKLYKSSINKSIHFVQRSLSISPRGH